LVQPVREHHHQHDGQQQPRQSRRQARQQPPPQQQQYAPQPYAPPQPPQPTPRQPRQRGANPMRIPGLGCLKGCLFSVILIVVAGWLVWELTPLQGWIAEGKSYWSAIGDGISKVSDWISDLGGSDPGAGPQDPSGQ
ncbi:serine/threonine protein kinase, partial [Streptomyces sp. NPDC051098]